MPDLQQLSANQNRESDRTVLDSTLLLTIPTSAGPGLHEPAPLPRHLGESPDPEEVAGAAVQRRDLLGRPVAVVRVHPLVRADLARRLVLDGVLDDAAVGVVRRLPLDAHRVERDGLGTDVLRGRGSCHGAQEKNTHTNIHSCNTRVIATTELHMVIFIWGGYFLRLTPANIKCSLKIENNQ